MHSAPCTKCSSSISTASWMARISSFVSSRESTAREKPSSFAAAAPCGVCRLIWVEACSGSSGAQARSRSSRPRSCTSTASTGRLHAKRMSSSARGSSSSRKSVFTARCTRTPRAWQPRTASRSPSSEKFCAEARAENEGPPR